MAKIIKYKVLASEVNHGTEEAPNMVKIFTDMEICCPTEAIFSANYPIAEKEAYPGTIDISGEFDSEPEEPGDSGVTVWDELDAAYQEGVESI